MDIPGFATNFICASFSHLAIDGFVFVSIFPANYFRDFSGNANPMHPLRLDQELDIIERNFSLCLSP